MTPGTLPAGFVRVTAGRCEAVTRIEHRDDAEALLAEGTLYEAAARDLAARRMQGRGVAFAITLPVSGTRVVVRHNRHGGALAPLTRDLFLPPTRAPYELATSVRLAAAGVRTPDILMYGVQHVGVLLRRSDVVTREIGDARDLATYMMPDALAADRAAAWRATRELVRALGDAGARHHDLNVKNVLLAQRDGELHGWILDVDRVVFGAPGSAEVRAANAARLLRSARKWRDERGALFDERELGPAELGSGEPRAASHDMLA